MATAAGAQQYIEDSLIRLCREARTDQERINVYGNLSDYYYANKNFTSGDSLIEKQIMLAEATMDRNLILKTLFGNAGYRSTGAATKDRSRNTIIYINRAIEYAKANDLSDYTALAYSNMAAMHNSDGRSEEAFKDASLAFTTALNTGNDSVKVTCAIVLGNTYLQRSDFLMAFKTYTNAGEMATHRENGSLSPLVFHAFASLYKKLGKDEVAKSYIFHSLAINKKNRNINGQINDNIFLAKLTNYMAARDYLQEAIRLADSSHNGIQKIEAQKILFSYMLLREKPGEVLAYLEQRPGLKNVLVNTGPDYMNWMRAEIYFYGGMADSALAYFKKAESSFNTGYDLTSKKNFFLEYSWCLRQLNNIPAAISYFEKSIELSKATADLFGLRDNSVALKELYEKKGDFKQALYFNNLFDHYKDSVDVLGKEKDLALLEIDNETKSQLREAQLAEDRLQRRYNLQYMLITIVVASVFVLMIMIGMFKVSTGTIRVMGFLSLIFLFEFIILVLDKWIHHITHGEPWKNWLIKIAIISFLLPVHHFLEHKLIHYLLSRHLITIRNRISIPSFLKKKKKPLPGQETDEAATGPVE